MARARKKRRMIVIAVAAVVFLAALLAVHPFLAVTRRESARLLVVEGWLYDKPIVDEVIREFRTGAYDRLITVGMEQEDTSGRTLPDSTAEILGRRLVERGVTEDELTVITVPLVDQHRTFATAVCLQQWLSQSDMPAPALNLFTGSVHARKSRLLFQKALADVRVGVIASESSYNPAFWWLSRDGIRLVVRNSAGYIYALSVAAWGDRVRERLVCSG